MINQHESPFYTEEAFQCQRMHKRLIESFPISKSYQAHIPSYPSGHWLFGFASKKYHPLNDLDGVSWNLRGIHTKYYLPRGDSYKILSAESAPRSLCTTGVCGGACKRC